MGFVRSLKDMLEKYRAKYVPDTITTRFTQVKALMDARYEGAVSPINEAVETTRTILTNKKVPPAQWGKYIAFAEMLQKYAFSHSGGVLEMIASGLKSYFVTAHDCDPAILDEIAQSIIGVVPPY